jgi:hypothetical protein
VVGPSNAASARIVPADDPTDNERRRWFYNPTNHGGLTIHQQRPAQQRAAMRLVSTGLSPAAYVTVATIMGLENVLDYIEGFVVRFNRERGRDPGLYYLRVFGKPGDQGLWGWRFGGHHVSLNNLVVDGVLVATTPCFLGADPATSPLPAGRSIARLPGWRTWVGTWCGHCDQSLRPARFCCRGRRLTSSPPTAPCSPTVIE